MPLLLAFTILAVFVAGTSIGSFLGVLLMRTKKGTRGIITGRSQCPKCKKTLAPHELIPVLSYILQKGNCRHCKKEIDRKHLDVELLTGIAFVLLVVNHIDFTQFHIIEPGRLLWEAFATLIFLMIFFNDLWYMEVADSTVISGIVLGIIAVIAGQFGMNGPTIEESLVGGAIGLLFFGTQYVLSRGKWIGEGDIGLGVMLGVMFGWQNMAVTLFLGYICGSIVGMLLLIWHKAKFQSSIALGPFLMAGGFTAMLYGEKIINLFLNGFFIL